MSVIQASGTNAWQKKMTCLHSHLYGVLKQLQVITQQKEPMRSKRLHVQLLAKLLLTKQLLTNLLAAMERIEAAIERLPSAPVPDHEEAD